MRPGGVERHRHNRELRWRRGLEARDMLMSRVEDRLRDPVWQRDTDLTGRGLIGRVAKF